ncbi:MAG: sigma-70 family RNA polymerase sigma factor [Chloroflexota bacterium]
MIVIVLPDIPTEDRLLVQARRGDSDAIMQIYERYFPPVYQFIRLRVDDTALAEDLTSEVFVKLVDSLRGRSAPQHSLRGWIFRVARNVMSSHFGKIRQYPVTSLEEWVPSPADSDPEVQFIRSLNLERARKALRMLNAEQQEVLILRFGQKLDLQATADIMGKSVSAIKSLQFRAVNTLRQLLGDLRMEIENG